MKKWDSGKIFTIFVVTILVSGAITVGLFTADAFAANGVKKLFITGSFDGVKVPLKSCLVNTDVNPTLIEHFAKGSGIVHADLDPDPVTGISPTKTLYISCTSKSESTSGYITQEVILAPRGPTKLFVSLS